MGFLLRMSLAAGVTHYEERYLENEFRLSYVTKHEFELKKHNVTAVKMCQVDCFLKLYKSLFSSACSVRSLFKSHLTAMPASMAYFQLFYRGFFCFAMPISVG